MSLPTSPSTPPPEEQPRLVLEVSKHRCTHACMAQANRPLLVRVSLNPAARRECLRRTGTIPADQYVCVNHECGALMQALYALAPLQELVR